MNYSLPISPSYRNPVFEAVALQVLLGLFSLLIRTAARLRGSLRGIYFLPEPRRFRPMSFTFAFEQGPRRWTGGGKIWSAEVVQFSARGKSMPLAIRVRGPQCPGHWMKPANGLTMQTKLSRVFFRIWPGESPGQTRKKRKELIGAGHLWRRLCLACPGLHACGPSRAPVRVSFTFRSPRRRIAERLRWLKQAAARHPFNDD